VFFPTAATDSYLDATVRTGTYLYFVEALDGANRRVARSDALTVVIP
jgi:hypothetical protein